MAPSPPPAMSIGGDGRHCTSEKDGIVTSVGDVSGGDYGIFVQNNGDITSVGDVSTTNMYSAAIYVGNSGNITSTGNINSAWVGIGTSRGDIVSTGDIYSDFSGIDIRSNGPVGSGSGNIRSHGNITSNGVAINISNNGSVISVGNIIALSDVGIRIDGNGSVISIGDVTGYLSGIRIIGDGTVSSVGNVTSPHTGIDLEGNGSVNVVGAVTAGDVGIQGGAGDEHVEVQGNVTRRLPSVSAAVMTRSTSTATAPSTARLTWAPATTLSKSLTAPSCRTRLTAARAMRCYGDLLLIGDGQICSEDGTAVANAQNIDALDPDSGSVTYLGQTYTWTQFEHIASGAHLQSCAAPWARLGMGVATPMTWARRMRCTAPSAAA